MQSSRRRSEPCTAGSLVRHVLVIATTLGVVLCLTRSGSAQEDYPSRPVRTVIGLAAGGGADIIIRHINKRLDDVSGKSFIVENKPGGGQVLATSMVATSKPDGYTLLHVSNSIMVGARYFQKDVSFDTLRDFTPIASYVEGTFFIAVGADSSVRNMTDLVAFLKSRPQNRFSYTTNLQLLAAQFFATKAGINVTPVSYRNLVESVPDLMSGTLEFGIMDLTFGLSQLKANKLRAIALTSANRYPGLDIPTMKELGFSDADFSAWWALLAPKGTPAPIISKLGGWMNQVTTSEETKNYFANISNAALSDDGPATAKRIQSDVLLWEPLIKAAGIVPQ